ncbi:hypothetical protein B4N89_43685 [Embleya scabrispora]|uniref:DUF1877 family protein n=1 Tax=Embleya scabrispora TaxID=159449 RepID=A0A1T3NKY0_9ACTN|nr:hypothetical protein [Embleya scabrispora]OPC77412.1 hypothetical protein B4N89_43685 [Embleya scabrispora]
MSMWLTLAKVEPSVPAAVRERPELIGTLFVDPADEPDRIDPADRPDAEQAAALPGEFRPRADSYGLDYRLLAAVAESRARAEEDTADWEAAYPWLARATGHGCDVVDEYEFCYGPAFVLGPDEVRRVAEGLVAEGWSRDGRAARWDGEREDHELEDLGPFFAAAAAEGRAVIGGVD